jgi:iron complex transport system substrate-binding protein
MAEQEYDGIYSDLTEKIISAAIDVHRELGCGLKEEAYEAVLAWELGQRGFKVERQVPCSVVYKGHVFCQNDEHPKRIDLLVEDKIVVEIKALPIKHPVFAYQCRTYLYMMNLPVGLVLNFGFPTLKEGLEHVDNFKASNPPNLPRFHTPNSESNLGSLTPKTPPNLPASSSPGSESNPSTSTPSLPHSSSPNSESNPSTSKP